LGRSEKDIFNFNLAKRAQEILEKLVRFIVDDGEIKIISDGEEQVSKIILRIRTSNPGILIGRHGHTLDAIQYIVNIIANKGIEISKRRKIIVDIEDYKEKRKEIISKYAYEKADIVKRTGKKIALSFMNAVERKIVHLALQEDPLVITYSEGTEPYRKVIIAPRKKDDKNNNVGML